ncbi:MAG TPA: hypothetical protein VFV50_04510 [Bdellovibrionales bacterium]|nr:hypothetical protein [Bdellovibrionales bacterium]
MRMITRILIQALVFAAVFSCGLIFSPATAEARKPVKKMKVSQPLAGRLMTVLVETEALHRALVGPEPEPVLAKGKGKKPKEPPRAPAAIVNVNDQIKTLSGSLTKASQHSKLAGPSSVALDKIISAAQKHLRVAQNSGKKNQKQKIEAISESFRQIIQIAQMYELDHQYKIFFCSKDRSYWIQSGGKAQHPFDSTGKLKSCGIVMR